MGINNRDEFIAAQASEKITLAHVQASSRLIVWSDEGGGVWSKDVAYFTTGLADTTTKLTSMDLPLTVGGVFNYDSNDSKIYVRLDGDTDPNLTEMIGTYKFFYSDAPVATTADLTDTGVDVRYQGRIQKAPGYKHKIGVDQNLISLVGSGDLVLNNNDGAIDSIFDKLIFENKDVEIFSWSREIPASEAKRIFRGKISDKIFSEDKVTFKIKDAIFDLQSNVPQGVYSDDDNVNDDVKGRYKRWVYGRVDGLQLQSTDQIGDGYAITGTVSSATPTKEITNFSAFPVAAGLGGTSFTIFDETNKEYRYWYDVDNGSSAPSVPAGVELVEIDVNSGNTSSEVSAITASELSGNFNILQSVGYFGAQTKEFGVCDDAADVDTGITITTAVQSINPKELNGVGTLFLSELSPGDKIAIDTQEFNIESVTSDTVAVLDDGPTFSFSGQTATIVPEIPTTNKNRDFLVAAHATARVTKQVTSIIQLNRIGVNNVTGLSVGDIIDFPSGEDIEIKNLDNINNIIVLQQNVVVVPSIGADVVRQPVQEIFVASEKVRSGDFTLTNTSTETIVTLDSDAEFNIARNITFPFDGTFTNGTRSITTVDNVDLTTIVQPRDFIRPNNVLYTTYYEILAVDEKEITLRTNFTDPTITSSAEGKTPNYVGDDTIVSANVLGRTIDNDPEGTWIETAAGVARDLLRAIDIPDSNINEASFTQGAIDNKSLISLALPLTPSSDTLTVKGAVDLLSRSTTTSLTLDNDLNIKFKALYPEIDDNITVIQDENIISWKIKNIASDAARFSTVRYRHQDIERFTQESGNKATTYDSEFVEKYVGTNKTISNDYYLYKDNAAAILSHRLVLYKALARAELEVKTDLRYEALEIGDSVIINFKRFYKRMGDQTSSEKVLVIIGKTVTGDRVTLQMTDFSNLYNRSTIITPNTAPDYSAATSREKLKYGFITTSQGIIGTDEDTANLNVIT